MPELLILGSERERWSLDLIAYARQPRFIKNDDVLNSLFDQKDVCGLLDSFEANYRVSQLSLCAIEYNSGTTATNLGKMTRLFPLLAQQSLKALQRTQCILLLPAINVSPLPSQKSGLPEEDDNTLAADAGRSNWSVGTHNGAIGYKKLRQTVCRPSVSSSQTQKQQDVGAVAAPDDRGWGHGLCHATSVH
jgi:hypothetical protein